MNTKAIESKSSQVADIAIKLKSTVEGITNTSYKVYDPIQYVIQVHYRFFQYVLV